MHKPAFSYHCIVSIVPATRTEGLLVITGVEKSEKIRKEKDRFIHFSS